MATRIRSRASQRARAPGSGRQRRRARRHPRVGHAPQRELAQGHQVRLAEESLDGGRDFVGNVDLAGREPCNQVVGRQVDQFHLVRLLEDPVGHGLALAHAGDLRDDVVQALEMLDVDGGPDVDAGIEQFLDVLPALGVARRRIAAGQVGVRQLVDQQDRRTAPQRGIEVELVANDSAISDRHRREPLEPFHQPLGLDPPVRLDVADDDFGSARLRAPRRFQHGVGLADARGRAEENAQAATPGARFFRPDLRQQFVRVRTRFIHASAYAHRFRAVNRARDSVAAR